jgi:hypothetical protein
MQYARVSTRDGDVGSDEARSEREHDMSLVEQYQGGQDPNWAFQQLDLAQSPDAALAEIFELVEELNRELANLTLDAALIEKLRMWVAKMGHALHELAPALGAQSYSLTVGFPAGVSVGLTYSPT